MSEDTIKAEPVVSQDQLRKAEAYIEAEEGVVNRLVGWAGRLVTSIAVAMSLFHLYAAIAGAWPFTDFPIIATQPLRYAHVAFVLMLSFLLFPLSARFRNRIVHFYGQVDLSRVFRLLQDHLTDFDRYLVAIERYLGRGA